MKMNLQHFNSINENYYQFSAFGQRGATNAHDIEKMKRFVANAIKNDLTPLQQFCVTEHCINGRKQKDIAEQLKLSRSTVSRHISAGTKKLRIAAEYYLILTKK